MIGSHLMDYFPAIQFLSHAYLIHFLENTIRPGRSEKKEKKAVFIMKPFLRSLSAPTNRLT